MARSFSNTAVAEAVIEDIKNGKYSNSAVIYGLLNQIINDLPGTDVAKEAVSMKNDY